MKGKVIFISPVPEGTWISQKFGVNPNYYKQWGLPGHEGIDYGLWAKVFSIGDGVVYSYGSQHEGKSGSNYGKHVRIRHVLSDGRVFCSIYAHLQDVYVKTDQIIKQGDPIGFSGNTGNSTGIHLHLTMKLTGATENGLTDYPGDIVDPNNYFGIVETPPLSELIKKIKIELRARITRAANRLKNIIKVQKK